MANMMHVSNDYCEVKKNEMITNVSRGYGKDPAMVKAFLDNVGTAVHDASEVNRAIN